MRPRLTASSALVSSLVLHATVLGAAAWLLSHSLSSEPRSRRGVPHTVDVTLDTPPVHLPGMSASYGEAPKDPEPKTRPEPVVSAGGSHTPRPDRIRRGRGGSPEVNQAALNLADSNDGLTLNRDPFNRLDRSQVQRLATERERRSLDDRRATPHPMELSFVASGAGRLQERRDPSQHEVSNGILNGGPPQAVGAMIGGAELEPGAGAEPSPGAETSGGERERPGEGSMRARSGDQYRRDAAVMLARPWVPEARAAVAAAQRGRPNDTLDSAQEVAGAIESLIHASTAGGIAALTGPGGQAGAGPAASGGVSGPGSRALPSGDADGPARAPGQDAGVVGYFRGIISRVDPYWKDAFPHWALTEGRGGIAIIGMTLEQDGSVAGLKVVRGSGVQEFDRNVLAALERAAPYGPLPAKLGRGPLTINVSFDALNPAVGRDGPGRGRAARRQ